jgi:hypothetical protein
MIKRKAIIRIGVATAVAAFLLACLSVEPMWRVVSIWTWCIRSEEWSLARRARVAWGETIHRPVSNYGPMISRPPLTVWRKNRNGVD